MSKGRFSTITYGPIHGTGHSLTEARNHAIAQLTHIAEAVHTGPLIGQIQGIPCAVWPTLDGWTYTFTLPADDPPRTSLQPQWSMCGTSPTRAEAARRLRYHLAQLVACAQDVPDDTFAAWLQELDTTSDRADLTQYRHWQSCYRQLRDQGYSDVEAHQLACVEVRPALNIA